MPNKDFREFVESLNSNKVKYLIVGGNIIGFHGRLENLKKNKKTSGQLQDLADLEKIDD